MTPVLSVRDLTTSFRVGYSWRAVVRNLSFDVLRRKRWRSWASPGRARASPHCRSCAYCRSVASRVEGSVRLGGSELTTLDAEAMRQVRGAGVAMIFQEPMTSLNPIFPVGEQIAEAITVSRRKKQNGRARGSVEAARPGHGCRTPGAGFAIRRTAFPAACGSA